MGMHSVVVDVFDTEEIVLVAAHSSLAPSPAHRLHRIFTYVPVHYIYLVNELFNYMIS